MVTLVLILHFIMGSFFPFLLSKLVAAIENLSLKIDMYEIGFILEQDYLLAYKQAMCWLGGAIAYLILYGFVIYVSLNILSS